VIEEKTSDKDGFYYEIDFMLDIYFCIPNLTVLIFSNSWDF